MCSGSDRVEPTWRVIAVLGPTASGKTTVAEELALRLGGEIVSADSMQVYRGMDIGTAKPPPSERRIPYHCIDLADPGEPFSAALYQRAAREAIADIAGRGRVPIVAGGTGMYVRAALDDWSFPRGEQTSPARTELERLADEVGAQVMHDRLRTIDPESAALIHPNNTRRTIRALEMAAEGVSYAAQASGFSRRRSVYDTVFVGLHVDREVLYRRIEDRVDAMIAAGLLGEVEALLAAGYRSGLTATQAIGYKELVPVLEEDAPLPEAVAAIKQATRRYAKRQLTWLRADPRIRWVDVTGTSAEDGTRAILDLLESDTPAARLGDLDDPGGSAAERKGAT